MVPDLLVYGVVVVAAAWTGWSLFFRGWLWRRAAARSRACGGPKCNCGD